jgi:rSAM/selenodomain-associated transferase 2
MTPPELSIIIPTLNEAESLPLLLADLVQQREVAFEIVVSDGGSVDSTCTVAEDLLASGQLFGVCVVGPCGRGRQLNLGVKAAKADWLLFLHADSRIRDVFQLRKALDFICEYQQQQPGVMTAGRFSLEFDKRADENRFGLFYYEAKARLGRPGSIHGDQGMLMTRACLQEAGSFREDLPVMEDTSIAEVIRASGQWLLLPGVIVTSARRFQVEGINARQTLNALMMNFLAIGWFDFFLSAPEIYRQQDRTQPLQLLPFFMLIRDLLGKMPIRQRWGIWLATGGYVRSQAWQLGFALDCRKAYQQGAEPGQQTDAWLKWFDRWFEPLTNHCVGHVLTALLVRLWFSWQLRFR